MTYALVAALCVSVAGYPVMFRMFLRYLEGLGEERGDLLQRIQAPEVAVVQHATRDVPAPEPVVVFGDEDKDWWAAQGFEPKEED